MANLFTLFRSVLFLFLVALVDAVEISGVQGGVNTFTGQRPARQDISTFQFSGAPFDLYILSLEQFLAQDQADILSYYQIAVLWSIAQKIARQYPISLRGKYIAAAQNLRLTYWDWAINPTMPAIVNSPMINVTSPQGPTFMVNPLYNYTFHPQPSASDFPPDQPATYHSTVRGPDSAGQSQPDMVNKQLAANGQAFQTLTYQLLAAESDYAPFSNTGYFDSRGNRYNSLENMHNVIHSIVGSGGHMSDIPFAGFDPIFWLHHANVDRLFAIWQALYPDSYTTPEVDPYGTFTNKPGETEDINTALTPFHSDNASTLYTSATVRSTKHFGYTYPEVSDWKVTPSQLSSNVRANVNAIYNPTGSIAQRSLHPRNNTQAPSTSSQNATSYQYFVNIRVNKFALATSFFIHFYFGPVPPSPTTWSYAPNLIATFSILTTSNPRTITTTTLTYGQIPLNHVLPADLSPTCIIPLLKQQLNWRVQLVDGSVVDVGDVAGLSCWVVGQQVVAREREDAFPGFGEWQVFGEVTEGREGGWSGEG
ncbi:hypothetical protein MMC12_006283 [Toensbergia leucococca]|nr:hypothetical protein [Toensbergia leucococca]